MCQSGLSLAAAAVAASAFVSASLAGGTVCPAGTVAQTFQGRSVCVRTVKGSSAALTQQVQSQRTQIAVLASRLSNEDQKVQLLFVVLGAILALGAIGSFVTWYFPYRREGQAQNQLLAGEQAAQERAEAAERRAETAHAAFMQAERRAEAVHGAFLGESQQTLELVNSTLSLARDASQRAADEMVRRATTARDDLDREARGLLAEVAGQDDRALIADPDRRSRLRTLAQKIAGFESSQLWLPVDVQLRPPAIFIRGMDFHLGQQFADAIAYWERVALHEDAPDDLRTLAWYWVGYEHNNLRDFDHAHQDFENALRLASGARRFEIQRMLLETRLFNKGKEQASNLIEPLEQLVASMVGADEEIQSRRIRTLVTLGNTCYAAALDASDGAESVGYMQKAADAYGKASDRDKWATFGLAQARDALAPPGEPDPEVERMFRESRTNAEDEFTRREEPRTKVLARTTELICCICVPEFRREARAIYSDLLDKLGNVDGRLTVYSQIQKRNVAQAEFRQDLTGLMKHLDSLEAVSSANEVG